MSLPLTSIQSLTLHPSTLTNHRRLPPIPQLSCVDSPAELCALADSTISEMVCTNLGIDTSSDDPSAPGPVDWSCTASLPDTIRLATATVTCEGYSSPSDPLVLRGSCGARYSVVLTDRGEHAYPHLAGNHDSQKASTVWSWAFAVLFLAVLAHILRGAWAAYNNPQDRGGRRLGGLGDGDGGDGGDDGHDDDPPPPYPGSGYDRWRPAAGAAAAAGAARYATRSSARTSSNTVTTSSSRESTGFGTTVRR